MNFSRLTLAQRLGGAFLLLIVMTSFISVFAIVEMGRINNSTQEIATSWLPSIKLIGEIQEVTNEIREAESDHILALDDKTMTEIEGKIVILKAQLDKDYSHYEALIADAQDRRLF